MPKAKKRKVKRKEQAAAEAWAAQRALDRSRRQIEATVRGTPKGAWESR